MKSQLEFGPKIWSDCGPEEGTPSAAQVGLSAQK